MVSTYRHTVLSAGLAGLVAAGVINGTLLAVSRSQILNNMDMQT